LLKTKKCGLVQKLGIGQIFISPVIVYIYYLVMTNREQPKFWKYWTRCPICEGTFAYKQTLNLAILFALPGFLLGFYKNVSFDTEKLSTLQYAEKTKSNHWKRVGIILVSIMVISLIGGCLALIVPPFQENSKTHSAKYIAKTFGAFLPQIGVFYLLTG
jgi:hypothetical protein